MRPAQRWVHVHVTERRGVDEDGVRRGSEIWPEVLSRLAALEDGDVQSFRAVGGQIRPAQRYGVGTRLRRPRRRTGNEPGRRDRSVAFERKSEDLLPDAMRRRVGVDVIAMIRLFRERLPKDAARGIEDGV